MNRTQRSKVTYLATIAVGITILAVVLPAVGVSVWIVGAFALFLLVPGRIMSYYWKDFYRGRHLVGKGQYLDCLPHLERFLQLVRKRPQLKKLIWFGWGFYTRDIEAMALVNIGAAHVGLERWDEAEVCFNGALELDADYPVPYANLAIIAFQRGDTARSEKLLEQARSLGYTGKVGDRLVRVAGDAASSMGAKSFK